MIVGSVAFLGSLALYMVYNTIDKNATKKQLLDDNEKDTNATGTIEDLRVTAFNAAFYKGKPANSLYKQASIDKYATDIHDTIHGIPFVPFTSNADRAVSLFSEFKTKAQISQVTESYNRKYKTDFIKEVEGIGSDHVDVVKKMIVNLPDVLK